MDGRRDEAGRPEGPPDAHPAEQGEQEARGGAEADQGRAGLPEGQLGRLLELLTVGQAQQMELLRQREARPEETHRVRLRVPEYDGLGDVQLFIQQFGDVGREEEWNPRVQLLKMREALTGKARDCAHADTIEGCTDALRARFGVSVRQARAGLEGLSRSPRTDLADHAAEVERLIRGAFPTLPAPDRESMAVDKFIATINHYALRNHLLARQPPTLEAAVRGGVEFIQIAGPRPSHEGTRVVETEVTSELERVETVKGGTEKLEGLLEQLTRLVGTLLTQDKRGPLPRGVTPRPEAQTCWNCNKEGHFKRECPQPPRRTQQGNVHGP